MHAVRESQAAEAEAPDADQTLGPPIRFACALGRATTKTHEDGITRLHGDERAEGIVDRAVHEPRNEAAEDKDEVGVLVGHRGEEVASEAVWKGRGKLWGGA